MEAHEEDDEWVQERMTRPNPDITSRLPDLPIASQPLDTRFRMWGDPPSPSGDCHTVEFQSAPRSLERGDPPEAGTCWTGCCFNPRPALSGGATRIRVKWAYGRKVSIRAPLSRAGRLWPVDSEAAHRRVSIRAPLSRAGRQPPGKIRLL